MPDDFNTYQSSKANYVVANVQNNWAEYVFYNLQGIKVDQTKIPYYPKKLISLFNLLCKEKNIKITNSNIRNHLNSLVYLGLINNSKNQELTEIGQEVNSKKTIGEKEKIFASQALELVKIKLTYDAYLQSSNRLKWTYNEVMNIDGILSNYNTLSTKKMKAGILLKWAEFIYKLNLDEVVD